jgi:hypothetical protein
MQSIDRLDVQYQLQQLVISMDKSQIAIVGLNQLYVPSTKNMYTSLTTKLFIALAQSKDNGP